jgi:hypothetical protein
MRVAIHWLLPTANGCTEEETFVITEPDRSTYSGNYNRRCNLLGSFRWICHSQLHQEEHLSPEATYQYLWSNGETTQTISNIPAGIYTVTVTDANGCTLRLPRPKFWNPIHHWQHLREVMPLYAVAKIMELWILGGTGNNETAFGGTPPYTYFSGILFRPIQVSGRTGKSRKPCGVSQRRIRYTL